MELSPLHYENLEKHVLGYNPNANLGLIRKAYEFANAAHAGQKRESGEDYIQHLLRVAHTLAELKLNSVTIAAGLLHDVLEDTKTKPERLKEAFGEEILNLVKGVTKITNIKFESREEGKAENIRKVLLATAKDIRVILIKLADRLHNMQTLKYCPPERQVYTAKETLEIYAPIAHKLGIYMIKSELEDLCLRYLHHDTYQLITKKVAEKKEEREHKVKELIKEVESRLENAKIVFEAVQGRAKSFYSIYNKMLAKNKKFEEIYDLLAIRIIVNTVEDCYKALGVIHSNWPYVQSEFKDYIADPKPNGYQSIHTQILFNKKPAEIQIRTMDMHREAEEGIAAHWRYKGTDRDKKFDRKISWLKQIFEWKRDAKNAVDFIENLKIDLFKDEIIIITPKGEPIALPEGATPIDYAYEIHTSLGNSCARVKVNNVIKPLDYELQSGDVVEIITQKNAKPSRQWLNFVKTAQAKAKIRQVLGLQMEPKKQSFELEKPLLGMIIGEVDKKLLRMSRCCEVKIGDDIVGFKTKDGRVHVHSASCPNLSDMENGRKIELKWSQKKSAVVTLSITVGERVGLAVDILKIVSSRMIAIKSINTKDHRDHTVLILKIDCTNKSESELKDLISEIKAVPDVIGLNVS